MSVEESIPTPSVGIVRRCFEELGLDTLIASPLDIQLLIFQRFVRVFAYGCSTLILVSYLTNLGFSEDAIGIFMALTLVGDVVISLVLALFADGIGRRATLVLGSLLMSASGIMFGLSDNYFVLLSGAILGVISPR
jgi:predicted MFS family arabinose efflux permease